MRVETTRRSRAVRLRHAAAFHTSPSDLLTQLVPLAAAARRRGEPVALAVGVRTEEAIVAALGSTVELSLLTQPRGPGESGQTVAAQRARELRELSEGGTRPVTVLAEHNRNFDGPDGRFWTDVDAATNVALAELPVALTCFFPELPLHREVLAGARRNHPLLLADGELRYNVEQRCPRDVATEHPAAPPAVLGPPDVRLSFGAWQLHDVRAAVEQATAGYERERSEDVVLAVNELATNAVEHGGPDAELFLWTGDGLVCEVHDRGVLGDPLPGLAAPHPSDPRGRGVWIARQLCDTLHVWGDEVGTHVRIHAAR